jgi:hypothetical protein
MTDVRLLIADIDIWLKAFSRTSPDARIALAVGQAVRDRRLLLMGPLRQSLLMRTRDTRQFGRLQWVLSGFPTPLVSAGDHENAARLALRLHGEQVHLSAWQALVWSLADRLDALVWSTEPRWLALDRHGCPLAAADGQPRPAP